MYSYCCIYSFKIFPFSVCMAYLQSFKIKFRIISRIVVSHLGIINFIYIRVFTEKFLWDYSLNIHNGAFWEGIQVILNFSLLLKFLNACIISAELEWWNCVTSRDLAQQEGWFRKGTDLTRPAQHQDGTACSPSRREQWRLFPSCSSQLSANASGSTTASRLVTVRWPWACTSMLQEPFPHSQLETVPGRAQSLCHHVDSSASSPLFLLLWVVCQPS